MKQLLLSQCEQYDSCFSANTRTPRWWLTAILRINIVACEFYKTSSTAVAQIYYKSYRAPKKVIQMFIPSCFSQQTWRNGRVAVPPVQFDFQNKMATVTTAARSRFETSAWAAPRDTNARWSPADTWPLLAARCAVSHRGSFSPDDGKRRERIVLFVVSGRKRKMNGSFCVMLRGPGSTTDRNHEIIHGPSGFRSLFALTWQKKKYK